MARKQDQTTRDILQRLNIVAEYRELGVAVVDGDPDGEGWIPCHAYGRDDSNPSAAICISDGAYKDHGGDGANLSLWDFAAEKAGRFKDWKEAKEHYAEKAGVALPKRKNAKFDEHLEPMPWATDLVWIWCAVHKPGVTPEAIQAFGGYLARYRDQYTVIVLPIRSYDAPAGKPVGAVLFNAGGGELPIWNKGSDEPTWAKMKTTAGSEGGWIGPAASFDSLESWQRVIKCEGVSDAMAIYSAMSDADRFSTTVITNSGGCNEHPPVGGLKIFAGKRAYVIHDADMPGQYGATGDPQFGPSEHSTAKLGWAPAIAREAAECRNVVLPFQIEQKHGKDVRDYLADGHTFADLVTLAEASPTIAAGQLVSNESAEDPHRLAGVYLARNGTDATTGLRTVVFWRDEFHRWIDGSYHAVPIEEMRSSVVLCIKQEFDRMNIAEQLESSKTIPETRKVTGRLVSDVLLALRSMTVIGFNKEQPHWLGDDDHEWPTSEVMTFRNGNLHLPSYIAEKDEAECLKPLTPQLFNSNSVKYAFDFRPAEPLKWFEFLRSVWPNDQESIDCLQEWFGYCLTQETKHHKLLMIVGVKRSGKGTIARVLEKLIGSGNYISPKLSSLGTPYGLWPFVGKSLAIFSDVRLSGRVDTAPIIETLLSITGEDHQTIDRKFLSSLTVRLRTRIVILSNDLPNMQDPSGAIVSRMLLLKTVKSFIDEENKDLEAELTPELPGILCWAIAGYERLQRNGRFTQPSSSAEASEEFDRISSPISTFVKEACVTGDHRTVRNKDLYDAWKRWATEEGLKEPGSSSQFFRKLRSAVPSIILVRPRSGEAGGQQRSYRGIGLRGDLFE